MNFILFREMKSTATDRDFPLGKIFRPRRGARFPTSPIHGQVNEAIEAVRAEGAYGMLFDVSANDGLIVAADKSLDLTQKVIDRIKAKP